LQLRKERVELAQLVAAAVGVQEVVSNDIKVGVRQQHARPDDRGVGLCEQPLASEELRKTSTVDCADTGLHVSDWDTPYSTDAHPIVGMAAASKHSEFPDDLQPWYHNGLVKLEVSAMSQQE